ncbi:bacterial non-heme ferritin-like [Ylistrum balloti]|uniref:bacterial non-heme ferritin-like n=1 Tax=Ylistrum balloti TaxID=509963 RepID=UPI002905A599|nr:bacterial non-heme ferritin-like [Ylistrum balloti]
MIPDSVQKALNDQINNELYSAYMYLSIAIYFDVYALTGFSKWMQQQAQEELLHARRLLEFMADQDASIELREIKAPQASFNSAIEALEVALQAEQDNTEQINDLYELAVKHQDHATEVMMQWFIQEQVEEERSARTVLDRAKLAGDDKAALLVLDGEMAKRDQVA